MRRNSPDIVSGQHLGSPSPARFRCRGRNFGPRRTPLRAVRTTSSRAALADRSMPSPRSTPRSCRRPAAGRYRRARPGGFHSPSAMVEHAVGVQRQDLVDVLGGAVTPIWPMPTTSPISRPAFASLYTRAPTSSRSGWSCTASTACLPTLPVAHWITRSFCRHGVGAPSCSAALRASRSSWMRTSSRNPSRLYFGTGWMPHSSCAVSLPSAPSGGPNGG